MSYIDATEFINKSDLLDIKKLKEHLDKNYIYNNQPYSVVELYILWNAFSDDYCASFLIVDDDSISDFVEWLENKGR